MTASSIYEAFSKQLNSQFEVETDENRGGVKVELVEISDLKLYPHQEEFTIVFRGPLDVFLGQGTRSFTHEKMGQQDIFIVPIQQDENGFYYEAVFNRLRNTNE